MIVQGVDWVREVHRHTSITKAGTNWVVFRSVQVHEVQVKVRVGVSRSSDNERVHSLEELRRLLEEGGHSAQELDTVTFTSDKQHSIVSNKVPPPVTFIITATINYTLLFRLVRIK